MDSRSTGYIFLTVAILGWGASAPLIELGLRTGMAPLPFLALRFLLASLVLTPYVLIKRRDILSLLSTPLVWLVGVSEALGLTLQYLGQQQQVPPGLAALLSLLFLLIVPFLSPFFLDETLHRQHLIAVALALVGVAFISSNGDLVGLVSGQVSILGVILLIGAALGYAFYIVFTSKIRLTDERVDTFALFYMVMVIITLTTGTISLLLDRVSSPPVDIIPWLVLLVLFSTLIAFVTYFEAMRSISANVASVLLLLQVFVAFGIEVLFLDASYTNWTLAGSVLILIAMVVAVLTPKPAVTGDYPEDSNTTYTIPDQTEVADHHSSLQNPTQSIE